jgi:hypothetical protein
MRTDERVEGLCTVGADLRLEGSDPPRCEEAGEDRPVGVVDRRILEEDQPRRPPG